MGMFDWVSFEMQCPECGAVVDDFQSKDRDCLMETLDFRMVNRFYSSCRKCKARIEFLRRRATNISDYEMLVEIRK